MSIGDILKVAGTSASIAKGFAGNGILGSVLEAITAASQSITRDGEEKRAIALAKLARLHPNADLVELGKAMDLQVAAMNAMNKAIAH